MPHLRFELSHSHAMDDSGSTQLGSLARGALRHDVARRLLGAIFSGEMPAGTRLVIQRLAEQFQISSTPIREALVELESIGIVEFLHNKGALVKPFGIKELHEIYHLRRVLETEATLLACGKIPLAQLQALSDAMQDLHEKGSVNAQWSQQEMATDRSLHALIAANSGSSRLANEIRRYEILVQAGRSIVGNERFAQQQALFEHRTIIDCLLKGNRQEAAAAMATHINNTAEIVASLMLPRIAASTVNEKLA